jgi:signal transduction histidine kinase
MTELINNTLKHAEAYIVSIDMHRSDKDLRIIYSDNGKGYDADRKPGQNSGISLQNIRNRVNLIGGTISFRTEGGKTVVTMNVPDEFVKITRR